MYELMRTDVNEGSTASDELEVPSILVKEYELAHHSIPSPNPLQAIKFRLNQLGISEKELGDILSYRSRKPEILSEKEN